MASAWRPDDARLCLERHATSKIRRADDLGAIATLGFRGEALPSIASVSHFRLRTRARGAASGTEIRINGGAIESVVEAGGPEGTLIEVADLFYNLPARRKFLKSDAAESAQISRMVTQLALCYPEIGFTLVSAGRKALQCPPVTRFQDRIYQIYGDRPDLIELRREGGGLTVHGLIAALAETGPTRGPQNVFVNRRVVKDRTIAHAILDAYSVASNRERSPEVHLFLELAAGSRRRQRAPDEGRGALPRAVTGARGRPPRDRRRARQERGAGTATPPVGHHSRAGRCRFRFRGFSPAESTAQVRQVRWVRAGAQVRCACAWVHQVHLTHPSHQRTVPVHRAHPAHLSHLDPSLDPA